MKKASVLLAVSTACGVLMLLPFYRLPADYFPARQIAWFWVALYLVPFLTLFCSWAIWKKRPKWKNLRKFLWVVCWFILFAVFEWFIELPVPRAVWEEVGDARIPAVFPTLGLGCSFCPWLEEW